MTTWQERRHGSLGRCRKLSSVVVCLCISMVYSLSFLSKHRERNVGHIHWSTVALTHQCGKSYRRLDRRPAHAKPLEQAHTLAFQHYNRNQVNVCFPQVAHSMKSAILWPLKLFISNLVIRFEWGSERFYRLFASGVLRPHEAIFDFWIFSEEIKSQMSNFISAKENVLLSWSESVEGLCFMW